MPTNGTPYRSQAWFDTPELLVNSFLVLILYVPPFPIRRQGLLGIQALLWKSLDQMLYPLEHFSGYTYSLRILLLPDRWRNAGVTSKNRKPGKPFRLSDSWRDLLISRFEDGQQLGNVVHVRELYMALNQQRFNRLLHCLLCIETQVLQVDTRAVHIRERQIAPGAVQPFPGILRRVAFGHGRLPGPLVTRGQ